MSCKLSSFIRHGWRKSTETCHKILFQSRSISDRNTSTGAKAHGNEALDLSKVFRWYSRFREGRELVGDDERGGLPKPTRPEVNIAAVANLVKNERTYYMHAYISTYIHTYRHTYMHAYIHIYIHTCIHA